MDFPCNDACDRISEGTNGVNEPYVLGFYFVFVFQERGSHRSRVGNEEIDKELGRNGDKGPVLLENIGVGQVIDLALSVLP